MFVRLETLNELKIAYTNETIDHLVQDDTLSVLLTVSIGAGQETLKVTVWPPNGPRQVNPTYPMDLGPGNTVRGKITDLLVRITDDNPDHDHTSVKIDLTNGEHSSIFEMEAETPGGTVDYYITINHS